MPPRVLCSSQGFSLMLLRMWEGLWTKEDLTCLRYCQSHACHIFPTLKTLHNTFGNAILVINFHLITWPKGSGAIHGQCEKLKYINVVVILLVFLAHHLLFIKFTSYDLCGISKSIIKHQQNKIKILISSK